MSTLIRGWTLLQKAKIKVSLEQKQKFSSTFYKRWQITKTASLVAFRRRRNLYRLSAFLKDQKELCSVAIGNFAQSFMGKKANSKLKTCFQLPKTFVPFRRIPNERVQRTNDLRENETFEFIVNRLREQRAGSACRAPRAETTSSH